MCTRQPAAKNQQMYVAGADTVVLLAEPDAWYVSRDGAKSWQRTAYVEGVQPPEYPAGDGGRFYVDDSGAIRDSEQPLTRQRAPEGARWLTNAPGGAFWLAGQRDGSPVTWVRGNGTDSWQPVPVTKQDGRPVFAARVAVSADGKDTWLVVRVSAPEPRPSIAVAVVTSGTRALLVRRRISEGTLSWQFPSGAIEPGESPLDAAKRETQEEVGLDVAAIAILGERVHPITDRYMIYVQCHAPEPNSARLVDSDELDDLAWCTWTEIQERIPVGIFEPVATHLSELTG